MSLKGVTLKFTFKGEKMINTIGNNLRMLRFKKNVLKDALEVIVNWILKYVNNQAIPKKELIQKLAKFNEVELN
jgi:transcriptional regulator with XRE-family HTH domain